MSSDHNHRIVLLQGDITGLEVDAIVNAANEKLRPGGGAIPSRTVSTAILAAALPDDPSVVGVSLPLKKLG